ncbi:hypothetical protein BDV41DRAFT_522430 [Aspergillus transmontanensis]|uniref:Uncharacterized protein n=1 Tax=Aspergillus transmontanensis TaxID=1034304 RepID=A0A5N6WEQ0_9EURO|nr:hypothetical protein BDV41DRAFT_522430 [Aspergillus transmontanensis]
MMVLYACMVLYSIISTDLFYLLGVLSSMCDVCRWVCRDGGCGGADLFLWWLFLFV